MANENASDIDIGTELEKQFPPAVPPSLLGQKPAPTNSQRMATVTEQIKRLAETMLELKREMDELEKLLTARLQAMRDRLGKL